MPQFRDGGVPLRVLILGGSSEATALAARLAGLAGMHATLSLAGRTATPAVQALPTRVGGFGGVGGLAAYLRSEAIDVLVDATHPYAAQISRHAREASRLAGCALLDVTRPPWAPQPGDRWREVATMAQAAAALGEVPARVFLTVGRLQLAAFARAPQHHYLVRTIDPVGPDHGLRRATFIQARGPFEAGAEAELMREHGIAVLVSKNSGGSTAKLDAARRLALPVVLVGRPQPVGAGLDVEAALAAIEAHGASTRRGV